MLKWNQKQNQSIVKLLYRQMGLGEGRIQGGKVSSPMGSFCPCLSHREPVSLHGLLTPINPCQYILFHFSSGDSAEDTAVGTWWGLPLPHCRCAQRGHWACLGVTAHPGLSPSQGSNADLTGELLTPLQCNLYVLPTSM